MRSAEIIAIVDVMKVEETKAKGFGWTYNEVATVKVDRVIKGELADEAKLYGKENFICAQVRYKPGKHLLFLRRDGDLLAGANWHLGVLPVSDGEVEWFESDKSIQLKKASLEEVIREIEGILKSDWPTVVQLRHESRGPVPLKRALWKDGTVLFSDPSGNMRVGTVHHPSPWRMWNGLREAGFFTMEREHYIVPDSDYETIFAHQGSEAKIHSWHCNLTRGFGGDIETDAAYRSFVEMWKKADDAISHLTPEQSSPLEDVAVNGTYRGYDLSKPSETPWLNPREWRTRK